MSNMSNNNQLPLGSKIMINEIELTVVKNKKDNCNRCVFNSLTCGEWACKATDRTDDTSVCFTVNRIGVNSKMNFQRHHRHRSIENLFCEIVYQNGNNCQVRQVQSTGDRDQLTFTTNECDVNLFDDHTGLWDEYIITTEGEVNISLYRRFLKKYISWIDSWTVNNPYIPENCKERNEKFLKEEREYLAKCRITYELSEDDIASFLSKV